MKFDESRIITDETGYNYVRVTPREILNWGGYCICNSCGKQFLDKEMNLFWAGSDTYCDDCFNKMKQRWKNYSKEDLEYDISLQNQEALPWYKYHLDKEFRDAIINTNNTFSNEETDDIIDEILDGKAEDIFDDDFYNMLREIGDLDESD